jgi:hypothetical protein
VKKAYTETCNAVLGTKKRQYKPWITAGTIGLIEERRELKHKLIQAKTRSQKREFQQAYNIKEKQVKKSARTDKRRRVDEIAEEAEKAAERQDLKELYQKTRLLAGKSYNNQNKPVKDKEGNIIPKQEKQMERWKEHFQEVLNGRLVF